MNLNDRSLKKTEAQLQFLGQAGFLIQSGGISVALDPYLTDSVGAASPKFRRQFPPPFPPEGLKVDIYIVTHDHGDHLDPDTIRRYKHRNKTRFVAPRHAASKLRELGVPSNNIVRLEAGDAWSWKNVTIKGTFALPTGPDVIDTTGYLVSFANGRSIYHTSDTSFTPLLLQAAPRNVDVLLLPINGKWGNLTVEQAAEMTLAVSPRYVIPNHFDLMSLNAENPESFRWFCKQRKMKTECLVLKIAQSFIWG